uniref:Uncharacterized protein n=1 Tax=Octopus bimaculoides TaxID=37653 RepID=A0A0L8FSK3_OCTBM
MEHVRYCMENIRAILYRLLVFNSQSVESKHLFAMKMREKDQDLGKSSSEAEGVGR